MFHVSAFPYAPQLLLLACLFSFLYFVSSTISTYRKLRHIPGPRLAAFSQLWLFNVTAKGDVYLSAEKVLRKYGASVPITSATCSDLARLSCQDWSQYDHS